MKTLSRFVTKFTSLIVAVLSCFDRVIFKGYLPIANGAALERFVDHVLKIRRMRLHGLRREAGRDSGRLCQATGPAGRRRIPFLQGKVRKDKLVDDILRKRPIIEGLICVLCCMECCPSFQLIYGKDRPRLVNARRQQRVLYFYFLDPKLGLIHIRLHDLVPVQRPGLRQRPLLAGSADVQATAGLHPARQRLHGSGRSQAAQKLADSFADRTGPRSSTAWCARSIP